MATSLPSKNTKPNHHDEKDAKETIETPSTSSVMPNNNLNAPKHGTVIPNRVFVGGISPTTTEHDLVHLFSNYGNVTGTKIIADRAGVSKGYGFVTFETEDEAKRLQKDADNIVLRERRLNIAPAIKKQGYGRTTYDCSPSTAMPIQSPVYRQNGVTYTFHNGTAFFPQPGPQQLPSASHIEPSHVFQQGTGYIPQGNPGPYPFAYNAGQIYYPTHPYQYQIPYESCYETPPHMVMPDGNVMIPQYLITQPAHDMPFYQTTQIHPQEHGSPIQPFLYPPRAYEPQILYPSEPNPEEHSVQIQEADTSGTSSSVNSSEIISSSNTTLSNVNDKNDNNAPRGQDTPVVSLLSVSYHNNQEQKKTNLPPSQRRKARPADDTRRVINNNNPEMANRNLMFYQQSGLNHKHMRRGSAESGDVKQTIPSSQTRPNHSYTPSLRSHVPPHISSFPLYPSSPRHFHHLRPSYFQPLHPGSVMHPPQRSRSFFNRPRYSGTGAGIGRGRGNSHREHSSGHNGGKWLMKDNTGTNHPLTPPVTPKSELTMTSGRQAAVAVAQKTDELVGAMQAVTI